LGLRETALELARKFVAVLDSASSSPHLVGRISVGISWLAVIGGVAVLARTLEVEQFARTSELFRIRLSVAM
jgi:hypothetical protein